MPRRRSPRLTKRRKVQESSDEQPQTIVEQNGSWEEETVEDTGNAEEDAQDEGDGEREDATDEETIDIPNMKMSDLCKELKTGRRSALLEARVAARKRKPPAPKSPPEEERQSREPSIGSIASGTEVEAEIVETIFEDNPSSSAIEELITLDRELGGIGESTVAPQVRVVNGQIVLDEDSLQVERVQMHRTVNEDELELIEENRYSRLVNSTTYLRKEKSAGRWTDAETDLFYKGINMWGTDFEIISKMFPNRTRRQIKSKYKREYKTNAARINAAMTKRVNVDLEEFSRMCGTTFSEHNDVPDAMVSSRVQNARAATPTEQGPAEQQGLSEQSPEEADATLEEDEDEELVEDGGDTIVTEQSGGLAYDLGGDLDESQIDEERPESPELSEGVLTTTEETGDQADGDEESENEADNPDREVILGTADENEAW